MCLYAGLRFHVANVQILQLRATIAALEEKLHSVMGLLSVLVHGSADSAQSQRSEEELRREIARLCKI